MRCPICRKKVAFEGNLYRPFCSERCKMIDLDNWLSERYRVSSAKEKRDESDAPADTTLDAKRGRN